MTREFEANVSMLRELQNDYSDRRIMVAGRYDPATGAPDPNVYNGLDSGFLWVRDREGRVAVPALMSVLTALCSVQFGDRIRTGINEEGDREAIAPYIVRQNVNKLNQVLYESKKSNLTPIEGLEGGVVREPQTAGLSVFVGAMPSLGWAGGDIAIDAGDVPANPNEFCWIVVYFTGVYGEAPTYTTTTPVISTTPDAFALTVAAAYAKELPNKAIRLWAVTYGEGQTAITYTESRFVHLRNTFNPDWLVTVDTSAASDGDVPTWDATAEEWVATAPSGGGSIGDYAIFREKQTLGTHGGTFTAGADQTRVLNEELVDTGNHFTLASNQITVTTAGTYRFWIRCPAFAVDQHVAWLYNVTTAADVEVGTSEFLNNALGTQGHCTIIGRGTFAGNDVLEVRHRCQTTRATDGFGTRQNLHGYEVYTIAEFWRE